MSNVIFFHRYERIYTIYDQIELTKQSRRHAHKNDETRTKISLLRHRLYVV